MPKESIKTTLLHNLEEYEEGIDDRDPRRKY